MLKVCIFYHNSLMHFFQSELYTNVKMAGATEIAGLDIDGPVWQGWTLPDYGMAWFRLL